MTPKFSCIPGSHEVASKRQWVVCSYLSGRQQPQLLTKCLAPHGEEEFSMYSSLADGIHSSLKAVTWSMEYNNPSGHCSPKAMLQVNQTDHYKHNVASHYRITLEENTEVK